MKTYLIWPEAEEIKDTASVLLAREEKTFEFVEDMIATVAQCFRSKRIHIGMDEAWDMGRGNFLTKHGKVPLLEIFNEYMERLIAITDKYVLTPMMDKITNGFKTKSQSLGVVTDYECPNPYYKDFPCTYFLDYTADNARQFVRETVEYLFGNGDGQLGADGVKLDFLSNHRDPSLTESYQNPERGIGMREMYLFYEMFYEEAKRINPEVIIDATVGDPRFEKFVDFNRMHDTHSGNLEKDLRVRVSTLACSDLFVDSDGALLNDNIQIDYARDRVLIHVKPGVVHTFADTDEGDSIERAFTPGESSSAEGDTDYVN